MGLIYFVFNLFLKAEGRLFTVGRYSYSGYGGWVLNTRKIVMCSPYFVCKYMISVLAFDSISPNAAQPVTMTASISANPFDEVKDTVVWSVIGLCLVFMLKRRFKVWHWVWYHGCECWVRLVLWINLIFWAVVDYLAHLVERFLRTRGVWESCVAVWEYVVKDTIYVLWSVNGLDLVFMLKLRFKVWPLSVEYDNMVLSVGCDWFESPWYFEQWFIISCTWWRGC